MKFKPRWRSSLSALCVLVATWLPDVASPVGKATGAGPAARGTTPPRPLPASLMKASASALAVAVALPR